MGGQATLAAGQDMTVIAVAGGEVKVIRARAAEVQSEGAVLELLGDGDSSGPIKDRMRVTLNYVIGGEGFRVRARTSAVDGNRVSVSFDEAPTRGEQRDFIRADVELPVFIDRLAADDLSQARDAQDRNHIPTESGQWKNMEIDLSGGGVSLITDLRLKKSDYLDFRVKLPSHDGDVPVLLIGEIVRARPGAKGCDVAVRFVDTDDDTQDLLFDYVSHQYHAQIFAKSMGLPLKDSQS